MFHLTRTLGLLIKYIAYWFNKIFVSEFKEKENIFNDEVAGLLILDQATSHMATNIINIFKKGFIDVTFTLLD